MDIQSDKPKKISVSIGGISYQLVSDETESYMKDIASKADEAIKKMLQNNPSLSNIQATVLAMVNLIDIMTKEMSEIDKMRARLEELSFSEAKAKHELYLQREHGFELKKEILRVNELNRQLELEVAALRQDIDKEDGVDCGEGIPTDIAIGSDNNIDKIANDIEQILSDEIIDNGNSKVEKNENFYESALESGKEFENSDMKSTNNVMHSSANDINDMNSDNATDIDTGTLADLNTDNATDVDTSALTDINTDNATDIDTSALTDMNTDNATDIDTGVLTDMNTDNAADIVTSVVVDSDNKNNIETGFNYNVKNVTRPASEMNNKLDFKNVKNADRTDEPVSTSIASDFDSQSLFSQESDSVESEESLDSMDSMDSMESIESEESAYIDEDDLSYEGQTEESDYADDLSDDPDSFHHYKQQSLDDIFH
jgi:cell division protein ZapA (FtsZ GTPase activity inhibitor)